MKFVFDKIEIPPELAPQCAPGTWECALAQLPGQGRILIAGAGRGGMSLYLSQNGFQVSSLDLYPEHFAVEGLTCEGADLNQPLNLATESFDMVIAVEVVEHLENPWGFLREAIRVLRPNGKLIFTSPNLMSLPSRLLFLRKGLFPYFREESFIGCYHVTPIFSWSVMRWAQTTEATVESITYSRVNWPMKNDIPRVWERRLPKMLKKILPINSLFGEIACYSVTKSGSPTVLVGAHPD